MNYRQALLMSPQSLGASGTKIVKIDVQKPISRINIRYRTTKGLSYMTAPGPANVLKIELVDGSKVIHGLTGYENQALAYYNRPGVSMEHGQHVNASDEVDLYTIAFGRYLWDEQLAFDPLRHDNPELKLTFNRALADTSASADEVEIWADIFDEKAISPMGFLLATEHYAYTVPISGGFEEISLPSDRPIRQILVRAHQDGKEPWGIIDQVRLDEGTMDQIPFDFTSMEDYYRRGKAVWHQIRTPLVVHPKPNDDRVFYIPQTDYHASIHYISIGVGNLLAETTTSLKGGKMTLQSEYDAVVHGEARGYLPWSVYQFLLGKPDVIDDWYNPTDKKPRLRVHGNTALAATADAQVVLEELYRY